MTFIRIFGQSCKTLQLLFWFPYHPVASWVFYGFLYILSLWKWTLHYCTARVCLPTHVCVFTYHQLESSAQLQPGLWERWTPQSYHIPTSPHQHCFCLVSGCGAGQHPGWDVSPGAIQLPGQQPRPTKLQLNTEGKYMVQARQCKWCMSWAWGCKTRINFWASFCAVCRKRWERG